MMEQGLLHLYWGDGKGKTTAAMGLAAILLWACRFPRAAGFQSGISVPCGRGRFFMTSTGACRRCLCCFDRIVSSLPEQDSDLVPLVWRMHACPVCGFSPG